MLVLLHSLRTYVFMGLALLVPTSLLLDRHARRRQVGWALATLATSAVITFTLARPTAAGASVGQGIQLLEQTRQALSSGRTAYADASSVVAREGDSYVIVGPDGAAGSPPVGSTGDATRSPNVIVIEPGMRIVLASETPIGASPLPSTPGVVAVRPGDIVIVSSSVSPGPASAPVTSPKPLALTAPVSTSVVAAPKDDEESLAVTRTLSYLPKGFAYALFAPFPWAATRSLDLLTVPEMLVWYVALVLNPVVAWRRRDNFGALMPLLLYVAGLLVLFALAEGNIGTLYRHRGMVVPFVIVIAAPGLLAIGRWASARARTVVGRRSLAAT
jgi:hypothetical protein